MVSIENDKITQNVDANIKEIVIPFLPNIELI